MNDFQVQIWKNNYKAPQDKTIQDTFLRVAAAVAKAEPDKETRELLATQFYKIMSQWKFIPGGRILANAGVKDRAKATLYNCYVYHPYDFGIRDIDSMQGIFQTLKKSAKILASQGGLGVNLSFIRPNGSYIVGTGARTPGVVKFMELWDKASDVITMGSSKVINDKFTSKAKKKIRKGAMLCFSQNTLILTNNGWIPIKQVIQKLQNGEEVFAIFQDGKQYKAKNPIINEPSEIYEVQAEDGTKIQCTADHRFVVYNTKTNQQYLKAVCDINPQYQLIKIVKNNDGKYADNLVEMNQTKLETQYAKLKSITLKRVEKSYDFQVEETHRIIAKHPDSENAFVTSNCAMDISHPEIKDFIIAKQTSNRLTKFNLSVLVPDRFMKALDANQMWKLCFPDIEYANYKEQWDGDLQRWISQGKPIVVYEQIPARELWDMIMLSTYNRNEPGILFYDTINDLNPVGYCQRILTTNPCGEIPQPSNVCNLGSLNLVRFVNDGKFDWEEFQKVIKLAVCFLDNVADISFVPLSEYEQKIKQKRRIGLGVMGLGSLLMMMKLKFGSHEAIEFVDELFKFKAEVQLMTSAFLGKSKGSFTAFDREKYFTSRWWYELPISYKIKREIENIGQMRNSVHSDTAPTGNCVVKNTKIRTEQGIKSIKDIFEENQIVLNQNINQWYLPVKELKVLTLNGYKRITGLYNNNINRVYQIGTKDEQISGTAQHKVLVKVNDSQAKWVKLSQLKLGEKILIKKDSSQFEQKLISKIQILEDYTYDIQVEDQHHYILDNGIISHNSAIFAGQVSNGIQPVFMKEYTRWVTMTDQQVEQLQHRHQDYQMDKFTSGYELQNHIYQKIPNPKLGQWYQTAIFKFAERGNEQILRGQVDGVIYEIDKNRGLIKPMQVIDYGWKYVKENIQSENYDWCVTTNELTVEDHINMLATSAKYINQNQSKTINIVEDYSYQQFKNVYTSAWRKKIKGVTSYRAGTMTVVLEQKKKLQEQQTQLEKLFKGNNGDIIFQDVKLPEKSYALQYKVKDKNKKKWYFTISFADKELTKPFAFFIRTNNRQSNEVADLVIQSMQELLISLGIREDLIADQRQKYKDQTNVDKIGRAIGMALRHNIPIVKIVETLNTHNDGLSTLMFHVKKILSGFIKDGTKVAGGNCEICGSTELVYQSGCSTCNNCGSSKCQ